MKFLKGYFYYYTGKQKKIFYKLECLYADENVAVMRPYYPLVKEAGKSFTLPQETKNYHLDPDHTHIKHQIKYFTDLREVYQLDLDKTLREAKDIAKTINDIDLHLIALELKGESK